MATSERFELVLIVLACPVVWFLSSIFPTEPELRSLIGTASVALLAQGLLRDSWLMYRARKAESEDQRSARCICVESTVGVTGVIVSLSLLGLGFSQPVTMGAAAWTGLIGGSLMLGFLIKDWVLMFGPFALFREKDHGGIRVQWRAEPRVSLKK